MNLDFLFLFQVSRFCFVPPFPSHFATLNVTFNALFSTRKSNEPSTRSVVCSEFLVRLWVAEPCLIEQSVEIRNLSKIAKQKYFRASCTMEPYGENPDPDCSCRSQACKYLCNLNFGGLSWLFSLWQVM